MNGGDHNEHKWVILAQSDQVIVRYRLHDREHVLLQVVPIAVAGMVAGILLDKEQLNLMTMSLQLEEKP